MNETLKRCLVFLGILVVCIVVYIYRSPHKTPREKMAAIAGAKPYSKAVSEGDLKSLLVLNSKQEKDYQTVIGSYSRGR